LGPGPRSGVHELLRRRRRRVRALPLPPDSAPSHHRPAHRAARLEGGPRRVPHPVRPARAGAGVPAVHRRARRRGRRARRRGPRPRAGHLDGGRPAHAGGAQRKAERGAGGMSAEQSRAPYLDALCEYAARDPARLHVPGHKGGPGADSQLLRALGERALRLDIPALTYGIDVGPAPTPFEQAQRLAAQAWGAQRTWFLINGASQGNIAAGLALAHHGEEVVLQRNVHSSTIDSLVLSGLRPTFAPPEVDPELGIAHCLTAGTLERALAATPAAVGAWVVSPTYFGAVADIRELAAVAHARGVPLIVDEAWGAHLAFHASLPEHALAAGADLVISSTHKIVGSLTQSAMLHLGDSGGGRVDEEAVDRAVTLTESTSPSSLLTGSLDAARRQAALYGRELLERTVALLDQTRAEIRAIDGLDVLDERIAGRPGGCPSRQRGGAHRGGVAGHLPTRDTERASGRASHRGDARLRAADAAARRQRARCKRPAAAQRARGGRAGGRRPVSDSGTAAGGARAAPRYTGVRTFAALA